METNNDWTNASQLPSVSGRYKVKAGDSIRFADFINDRWVGGIQFDAWLPEPVKHNPGEEFPAKHYQNFPNDFTLVHPSVFEQGSVDPDRIDLTAAVTLSKRELAALEIEFVRVFTVNDDAESDVVGKVLATSERFAAQHLGRGDVVVHEISRLSRKVVPGDEVTISYRDGLGRVFDHPAELRDVLVSSDALNEAEKRFIRNELMQMADDDVAAKSDDDFQLMVDLTLQKAAKQFGWESEPGVILVSQVDAIESLQKQAMDRSAIIVEEIYMSDFGFDTQRFSSRQDDQNVNTHTPKMKG